MTCSFKHTHKTHTHTAVLSFCPGNDGNSFGSPQALLCRAACHQTAGHWTGNWCCRPAFRSMSPPCWARQPGSFTRRRPTAGSLLRSPERWSRGVPGGQGSTQIHRCSACGLCPVGSSGFQGDATHGCKPLWDLRRPEGRQGLELQEDPWCSVESKTQW